MRVADQDAEDAATTWQIADPFVSLLVDPRGQEALQRLPAAVDHAEGGVSRAGQLRGGLDDALKNRIEGQLGGDGDSRLDQPSPAVFHRTSNYRCC